MFTFSIFPFFLGCMIVFSAFVVFALFDLLQQQLLLSVRQILLQLLK